MILAGGPPYHQICETLPRSREWVDPRQSDTLVIGVGFDGSAEWEDQKWILYNTSRYFRRGVRP